MFSSESLRNYRKVGEKGSILRFIRHLPAKNSRINESGAEESGLSDSCESNSDATSKLQCSKVCYVTPVDPEEEDSSVKSDPKDEGINIDAVVKSSSSDQDCDRSDSDSSPKRKPAPPKRPRIESDDDDDDNELPAKRSNVGSVERNGVTNGELSDEMVEKLLDTYCGIYPSIERMEIYDMMIKWGQNFSEMTKNLDTIQRERKSKPHVTRQANVRQSPVQRRKPESRISAKRVEKERMKKMWKLKGRVHQEDFDADEEEDYVGKSKVYVSDSSDEEDEEKDGKEESQETTFAREAVLKFFNEGTTSEIIAVPGCSKKKVDIIFQGRPFESWEDIVMKFKNSRFISAEMLNSAKDLLYMRDIVRKLMKNCEGISTKIESLASQIADENESKISKQPSILNPELTLKPYQLIGLNWLDLMHGQDLNGVLADEMGLGKTIQAISFLAHLKEVDELDRLCLIVVPTSTLDNWAKELEKWCPSLKFLMYHGSQDERRGMRMDICNGDLCDSIDLILTTYNMVSSSVEDRVLFRKIGFHTVIFDEAHMLKNMASQRYENLMKINAYRRILLTGTPLQNNLVELMSLLIFVMPQIFHGKQEQLKKVFSMFPKSESPENKGQYERERINEAKRIMKPFFLRRLKSDVLKDLPQKEEKVDCITMASRQKELYFETVNILNKRAQEIEKLEELKLKDLDELTELEQAGKSPSKDKREASADSSVNMLMTLRKISNHPLLVRNLFTKEKIETMTRILKKTTHKESNSDYIIEDFTYMSDFEIHKTCMMYRPISKYCLSPSELLDSGKFKKLDELLPSMKENGDKVLIFSQFVIMLDILEEYLKIKKYNFYRLDGSTQVAERQERIDSFNEDESIFIFLLSTRAGGLGINLSSANKVILHDLDFNPYNDKQAEDRCHRVGQMRDVTIHRFMSKDTIEEGIYKCALDKLKLEKEVTDRGELVDDEEKSKSSDVLSLLKNALGLSK